MASGVQKPKGRDTRLNPMWLEVEGARLLKQLEEDFAGLEVLTVANQLQSIQSFAYKVEDYLNGQANT